jgi:hypothetical protein
MTWHTDVTVFEAFGIVNPNIEGKLRTGGEHWDPVMMPILQQTRKRFLPMEGLLSLFFFKDPDNQSLQDLHIQLLDPLDLDGKRLITTWIEEMDLSQPRYSFLDDVSAAFVSQVLLKMTLSPLLCVLLGLRILSLLTNVSVVQARCDSLSFNVILPKIESTSISFTSACVCETKEGKFLVLPEPKSASSISVQQPISFHVDKIRNWQVFRRLKNESWLNLNPKGCEENIRIGEKKNSNSTKLIICEIDWRNPQLWKKSYQSRDWKQK